MKYEMIVTDLDGTLLRYDKTISDFTKNVINFLREKKHKIRHCYRQTDSFCEKFSAIFEFRCRNIPQWSSYLRKWCDCFRMWN